ncbi:hypothetical protein RIF29_26150 [Crotalaria pallida]|uniref:Uncharacterized protein n=1 Tax=Crotalaria pallida TaxID=3830 RepID=A0AAN9EMC2_CROPI
MARKRGRLPKTPSSSAKKTPGKQDSIDGDHERFDVSHLDEEDLEDIENLSPKKVETLLRNLDLLRDKIKEKVLTNDLPLGDITIINDADKEEDMHKKKNDEQASTIKKQPSVKKKPSREDIEKIDSALRAENMITGDNALDLTNKESKRGSESQCEDTVVGDSLNNEGEMSPQGVMSSDFDKDLNPETISADNQTSQKEQPRIPVVTRSKAHVRHVQNRKEMGDQINQASKANG